MNTGITPNNDGVLFIYATACLRVIIAIASSCLFKHKDERINKPIKKLKMMRISETAEIASV